MTINVRDEHGLQLGGLVHVPNEETTMKLVLLCALCLAFPATGIMAQARPTEQGVKEWTKEVPKGQTYVLLDEKNRELARYKGGAIMRRKKVVDCAQIPCPSTFGKNVVCWRCKARPASTTSSAKATK